MKCLHVNFFNSLPFVSLHKAYQPGCRDLSQTDGNKETLESLEHSQGINYGSLFSTLGPLISRIWFEKGMFTLGIDSTRHKWTLSLHSLRPGQIGLGFNLGFALGPFAPVSEVHGQGSDATFSCWQITSTLGNFGFGPASTSSVDVSTTTNHPHLNGRYVGLRFHQELALNFSIRRRTTF